MNPQKIDEKNKRKTRSRKLAERYEPPPLERAAVEAHFARR
jgi:hypothetical protein